MSFTEFIIELCSLAFILVLQSHMCLFWFSFIQSSVYLYILM